MSIKLTYHPWFNYCFVHFVLQEEHDVNYEEEPEAVDEFDSDFDEDVRAPFISFLLVDSFFFP